MTGCPDGRRNKKEYRKGETQYDKKEPVIPDAGVRAAADAGSLRGEIAKQQRKREPFGDGEHIGLRATGRVV